MRCFFILFLSMFCAAKALAACTEKPAQRVIVLAPDLVEDVFAIGAGQRIVGVIKGSDYPAAALNIPLVGSYSGVDLERIVSLHPDLIITWKYAFPRQLHALQQLKIPVYVAAPKELSDVPRLLEKLGCLLGESQRADRAAQDFIKALVATRPKVASHPTVFILVDETRLITINKESWVNQAIEWCGGKNIFADAKVIAPEVNREAIIEANPDVIFAVSRDNRWQQGWRGWSGMTAVKNKHLYTLNPDWISRASPRLVLGIEEICRRLG